MGDADEMIAHALRNFCANIISRNTSAAATKSEIPPVLAVSFRDASTTEINQLVKQTAFPSRPAGI